MSFKVTIEVVRKSDCMPWTSYYLGGNSTRDFVTQELDDWQTNSEDLVHPVELSVLRGILEKGIDQNKFYIDHTADYFLEDFHPVIECDLGDKDCLKFGDSDKYKFWIVIA